MRQSGQNHRKQNDWKTPNFPRHFFLSSPCIFPSFLPVIPPIPFLHPFGCQFWGLFHTHTTTKRTPRNHHFWLFWNLELLFCWKLQVGKMPPFSVEFSQSLFFQNWKFPIIVSHHFLTPFLSGLQDVLFQDSMLLAWKDISLNGEYTYVYASPSPTTNFTDYQASPHMDCRARNGICFTKASQLSLL